MDAEVLEGLRECVEKLRWKFRSAADGLPLPAGGLEAMPELLRGVLGAGGNADRSVYTSWI